MEVPYGTVSTWDNNLVQIMDAWMSSPQSSQGSALLSVAVDLSGPSNLTHLSFRRNDAVLRMELVASVASQSVMRSIEDLLISKPRGHDFVMLQSRSSHANSFHSSFSLGPIWFMERRLGNENSTAFLCLVSSSMGNGFLAHGKVGRKVKPSFQLGKVWENEPTFNA
ncbi:Disease resistance protein CC-NBS-LRR class family [Prunus dulcis]|uniref:Disease resistance protein CC-NBS-LRR class family n=1 Tax=Prunus dulcis TaxID=3755 RepID=A0A4Y1QVI3_PRUDU|nr:Disease resistance protein CC-NBS-LRR class family [Prunus dulcis]